MSALFRIAVFTAFVVLASPNAAQATAFCEIPRTADGFVALRTGPSPSAPLAARMRAGDEVMILREAASEGRWVRVRWWRGQDRLERGFHRSSGVGWVHGGLLSDCG